ncbi:MAG TPA: hypothetical protein VLB67_11500 [Acidimicrobiia bacterium]|nr:hypothetical protein [Acidimicrobiia bacterium]
MNLTVIPLLVVALLMMSADTEVESARFLMTGTHVVESHESALIVGEATVTVPAAAEVTGPIYVVAGELIVAGTVMGDVIQLAGTVVVEPGAVIGDELRHVAGTLTVSDGASVGRRTSLAPTSGGETRSGGVLAGIALTLVLAGAGYRFGRRRSAVLDNVANAAIGHPVVAFTVGFLLALTAIALFVFMAMTLLLIPVAIVGLVAGVLTLGYGVVAVGRLVGSRLPVGHEGAATALGVVVAVTGLQLLGMIPVVGDLLVAGVLLTGLGAVVLTYYGVTAFRPEALPD